MNMNPILTITVLLTVSVNSHAMKAADCDSLPYEVRQACMDEQTQQQGEGLKISLPLTPPGAMPVPQPANVVTPVNTVPKGSVSPSSGSVSPGTTSGPVPIPAQPAPKGPPAHAVGPK